jgi:hypothetical protein
VSKFGTENMKNIQLPKPWHSLKIILKLIAKERVVLTGFIWLRIKII